MKLNISKVIISKLHERSRKIPRMQPRVTKKLCMNKKRYERQNQKSQQQELQNQRGKRMRGAILEISE